MTWFSILKEQKVGIRVEILGTKELQKFMNELERKYSKNYEKNFSGEPKRVKGKGPRIPKRTLESLGKVPSKKTMEQRLGREAIASLEEVSSKIMEAPSKSKEWLSWLEEMGLEERPSPQKKPSRRTLEERMSKEEIISYLENRGEKIPEFENRQAEEKFFREFTLTEEEYRNRPEVRGPLQRLKELNELENEQEEEFFVNTEGKTYERGSFPPGLLKKIKALEETYKAFIKSLEPLNLKIVGKAPSKEDLEKTLSKEEKIRLLKKRKTEIPKFKNGNEEEQYFQKFKLTESEYKELVDQRGASAQQGGRVRLDKTKPLPSKEVYGQRIDLEDFRVISQFKKNGPLMQQALEHIEDVEFELDQLNDLTIEIEELLEENELELENEPVVLELKTRVFDIKE